jgi:hypothetical protein
LGHFAANINFASQLDNLWIGDIFGSGSLQSVTGEVSATFTTLRMMAEMSTSPLRWHFVLGWGLDNQAAPQVRAQTGGGYEVQCEDLSGCDDASTSVAWPEYLDGQPRFDQLRTFPTQGKGLPIPKAKGADYGEYVLWRTAPIMCASGVASVALLGESAKFISVSSQRIANIGVECSASSSRLSLALVGDSHEHVRMAYHSTTGIKVAACTLRSNGMERMEVTGVG